MRELGNLRTLCVDLLRLFGRHLGFECCGCRRLLHARNRTPPRRLRVGGSTLAAERALLTSRLSGVVQMCINAIAATQSRATSEQLSRRTSKGCPPFCPPFCLNLENRFGAAWLGSGARPGEGQEADRLSIRPSSVHAWRHSAPVLQELLVCLQEQHRSPSTHQPF